jgi:threonine/homoserine/homoserine lactone efflux protein
MIPAAQLWLFALLVLGVVALPGLDMACVLGNTLSGGRRRGFAALAGVVAGGIVHVVLAALGISVVLKLFPAVFNAMLIAGALYIAWIGVSLLRSAPSPSPHGDATGAGTTPARAPVPAAATPAAAFRQGLVTCLLNPKAYLFMLAVFPQFLQPVPGTLGPGALWLQVAVLWLVIAANQAAVYGGLALLAGQARDWLGRRPAAGLFGARAVGVLLLGVAAFTGVEGWQRL